MPGLLPEWQTQDGVDAVLPQAGNCAGVIGKPGVAIVAKFSREKGAPTIVIPGLLMRVLKFSGEFPP